MRVRWCSMSRSQKPRTPRYWPRMKAVTAAFLAGFDRGINIMLTRTAERLTVYGRWAGPATKTRGHVSGDELAHYIPQVRGYQPSIWAIKEDHAGH